MRLPLYSSQSLYLQIVPKASFRRRILGRLRQRLKQRKTPPLRLCWPFKIEQPRLSTAILMWLTPFQSLGAVWALVAILAAFSSFSSRRVIEKKWIKWLKGYALNLERSLVYRSICVPCKIYNWADVAVRVAINLHCKVLALKVWIIGQKSLSKKCAPIRSSVMSLATPSWRDSMSRLRLIAIKLPVQASPLPIFVVRYITLLESDRYLLSIRQSTPITLF